MKKIYRRNQLKKVLSFCFLLIFYSSCDNNIESTIKEDVITIEQEESTYSSKINEIYFSKECQLLVEELRCLLDNKHIENGEGCCVIQLVP